MRLCENDRLVSLPGCADSRLRRFAGEILGALELGAMTRGATACCCCTAASVARPAVR